MTVTKTRPPRRSMWRIGTDSGVTHARWRDRDIEFCGKWHPMICLMIAGHVRYSGENANLFVRAEKIASLPLWSKVKTTSVGATLARYLRDSDGGHAGLVEYDGLTLGWRLSQEARAKTTVADCRAAADALFALEHGPWPSFRAQPNAGLADWMIASCDMMIATSAGEQERATAAYGRAKEIIRTGMSAGGPAATTEIEAITDVLGTRMRRVRTARPPSKDSLTGLTAFEITALARTLSAGVPRATMDLWPDFRRRLYELVPAVTVTGDVASQAYLFNALHVIEKRMGNIDRAEEHIRTAVPLAIHTADLHLIQAVSFNFANLMWDLSRREDRPIDQQCFNLLALDCRIRDTHGLGKNSAATEQTLAFLALEAGDYEACADYLGQSFRLIRKHGLSADEAVSMRIRGKLKLVRASTGREIAAGIKDLSASRDLFNFNGRSDGASAVDEDLANARVQQVAWRRRASGSSRSE